MRGKSYGLWIGIIVWVALGLAACDRNDTESEAKAIPQGFVSLNEAISQANDSLQYVPWESQIALMDADGITIYQTGFDDESFIVKHKDEYYIDGARNSELTKIAEATLEQRNRIYRLGEPIELRKNATENYTVKVVSAEIETVEGIRRCTFRVAADHKMDAEQTRLFFDHVQTESGKILEDFTVLNDDTVQIRLPAGDRLQKLILKSPEYESATRTVMLKE